MTKEEATKKLADIIFYAAKSGYMPYDTDDEMCAMNIAKEHIDEFYTSLPSVLDEAAQEYEKKHTYQLYDGGGLTPEYDATLAEAFIAGYNLCKEQVMKETLVSDDLEEAADKYFEENKYEGENCWECDAKASFIAGAKWQKEKDERTLRKFFNDRNQGDASFYDLLAYREGHCDGMDEQKSQMMKGAVEGEVMGYIGGDYGMYISVDLPPEIKIDIGDYINLIIVKED